MHESYAMKEVRAEQAHSFHVQKASLEGLQNVDAPNHLDSVNLPKHDESSTATPYTNSKNLDDVLKLYSHSGKPSKEHPIERFLTPGASSDPARVYAKQALSDLNIPFGDGSTVEERKRIGKQNFEKVKSNSNKRKRCNVSTTCSDGSRAYDST